MPPEEKSSLEKLQEKLYSPGANTTFIEPTLQGRPAQTPPVPPQVPPRTASAPGAASASGYSSVPPQHWTAAPARMPKPPRRPISAAIWFLIGAAVFALIAVGISTFFLLVGARAVSNNNINITVSGPTTIASGTPVPLTVTIKNSNPADIINTSLELDFPAGTRSADDITQPLVRYTDTLGTISAGASANRTVQAVLFGSANQTVTIPITFQYNTANSNASYTKTQNYTFTITSSPLTITTSNIGNVASGQPFSIVVAVKSNAPTALDNVAVAAQYPAGFMPQTAGTTTAPFFTIGTLKPGQEKDLTVNGSVQGTQNQQNDFEFTVGTVATDTPGTLAVAYASADTQLTVTQPFLSATLTLNNDSSNPLVISPDESIAGALSWVNTLTKGITDGEVTVQVSGNAFDPNTITTTNGFYSSSQSTIDFTKDTEPSLSHLNAGDTGNGSFSLGVKSGSAFASLHNPTIQLTVGVSGTPDGASSPETIASSLTRTVEVSTDLNLTSEILHSSGPFTDNGVVPAVPNQPTAYTVLLSVTNDVNDVAGASASMILPSYVTFTGQTSPNDGSVTYNNTTNTVTWQIGDVPAGTLAKPVQAAFQISFLPSSSQSGTSPILVQSQTLTGTDRFTNASVGNTAPELTTDSLADPNTAPNAGVVAN